MSADRPIVLVTDRLSGGAGHAAHRLFTSLDARGGNVECWHFSSDNAPGQGKVVSLDPGSRRPAFERILKNLSRETANRLRRRRHTRALLRAVSDRRPRLIHLHNLHASGIDHSSLLQLPGNIPLAWSLHDCWPFAPDPFRWFDKALNRWERVGTAEVQPSQARHRRERFLAHRPDVHLCGPSQWMVAMARDAVGPQVSLHHIPYGLDPGQWQPLAKPASRDDLQLDPRLCWIGCAAFSAQRRKGLDLLAAALGTLAGTRFGLAVWGDSGGMEWPPGSAVRQFGPIHDRHRLNTLYSACDVFVCPSRMDNFPLTVLESMACATAVIVSDAGGSGEAVEPGVTGDIFEGQSAAGLRASLERLLQKCDTLQMGHAARVRVGRHYSSEQETRRWEDVHAELAQREPPPA